MLSYPNWVDATYYSVAFSGGSWQPALPLTNIRDRLFSKMARSTNATLGSTKFTIDLGVLRSILSLAIPRSNISRTGQVRVLLYQTDPAVGSPSAVGDTGWVDYWRTVYAWGSLPFEHPSWLDGKLTEEDRQGYPMPWVYTFASAVLARYAVWQFSDASNPDGYIDIPRAYMGPGWSPSTGIQVGATLGWEDPSVVEQSLGSVLFFDERPGFRVARFSVPYIQTNEGMGTALELIRQLKTVREMFFSYDASDNTNVHRWSFPATIRQLSPLEWATPNLNTVNFELREVVG
ncbi:hypothetical protein [Azospirillum sp. TSA6c]|uniref:hypothetical protein n=1 Tax=Azospirillum sp. TSA6c TaxID=709813 RepID=UPI0011B5CFAA|nr:hypothetical protein [Azospirillum sp. TSA6c]